MGNADLHPPDPDVRPPRWRRRPRIAAALLLMICLIAASTGYGCIDGWLIRPAQTPVDPRGASRVVIPVGNIPGGSVEGYMRRSGVAAGKEPDVYVLLFPGRGGRAEWAVQWAVEEAGGRAVEAWAVNYPGVGGSPGNTRLADLGPAALAAYDFVKARAGNKPIVISGPSLGSASALYVAANRPVHGLVISNPPPLRQMILQQYGWWNLWLIAGPAALAIPKELDSPANAAACKCPAVFITSGNDDVVPIEYQRRVIDAYAGPKQTVTVPGASHHVRLSGAAAAERYAAVEWIWKSLGR